MRVLVVYGSKLGGTEGIAQTIGEGLRSMGLDVDVVSAEVPVDPNLYDAAVIGGALYAGRWQRHARRFVTRHTEILRTMPLWFFSSGPLGELATQLNAGTAPQESIPPTPQVKALMARVNATHHVTFGGRLEKDAEGFIAHSMAQKLAGDWRDMDQIRAWGQTLGREILLLPARPRVPSSPSAPYRKTLTGLCLFGGLTAMAGGLAFLVKPDGSVVQMPLSALEHSPFETFLIPGLLLFGVVGVGNTVAAALVSRRHALANHAAFVSGSALAIWIVTEMIMIRQLHWLQSSYLTLALAIQILALMRWQETRAGSQPLSTRAA